MSSEDEFEDSSEEEEMKDDDDGLFDLCNASVFDPKTVLDSAAFLEHARCVLDVYVGMRTTHNTTPGSQKVPESVKGQFEQLKGGPGLPYIGLKLVKALESGELKSKIDKRITGQSALPQDTITGSELRRVFRDSFLSIQMVSPSKSTKGVGAGAGAGAPPGPKQHRWSDKQPLKALLEGDMADDWNEKEKEAFGIWVKTKLKHADKMFDSPRDHIKDLCKATQLCCVVFHFIVECVNDMMVEMWNNTKSYRSSKTMVEFLGRVAGGLGEDSAPADITDELGRQVKEQYLTCADVLNLRMSLEMFNKDMPSSFVNLVLTSSKTLGEAADGEFGAAISGLEGVWTVSSTGHLPLIGASDLKDRGTAIEASMFNWIGMRLAQLTPLVLSDTKTFLDGKTAVSWFWKGLVWDNAVLTKVMMVLYAPLQSDDGRFESDVEIAGGRALVTTENPDLVSELDGYDSVFRAVQDRLGPRGTVSAKSPLKMYGALVKPSSRTPNRRFPWGPNRTYATLFSSSVPSIDFEVMIGDALYPPYIPVTPPVLGTTPLDPLVLAIEQTPKWGKNLCWDTEWAPGGLFLPDEDVPYFETATSLDAMVMFQRLAWLSTHDNDGIVAHMKGRPLACVPTNPGTNNYATFFQADTIRGLGEYSGEDDDDGETEDRQTKSNIVRGIVAGALMSIRTMFYDGSPGTTKDRLLCGAFFTNIGGDDGAGIVSRFRGIYPAALVDATKKTDFLVFVAKTLRAVVNWVPVIDGKADDGLVSILAEALQVCVRDYKLLDGVTGSIEDRSFVTELFDGASLIKKGFIADWNTRVDTFLASHNHSSMAVIAAKKRVVTVKASREGDAWKTEMFDIPGVVIAEVVDLPDGATAKFMVPCFDTSSQTIPGTLTPVSGSPFCVTAFVKFKDITGASPKMWFEIKVPSG